MRYAHLVGAQLQQRRHVNLIMQSTTVCVPWAPSVVLAAGYDQIA